MSYNFQGETHPRNHFWLSKSCFPERNTLARPAMTHKRASGAGVVALGAPAKAKENDRGQGVKAKTTSTSHMTNGWHILRIKQVLDTYIAPHITSNNKCRRTKYPSPFLSLLRFQDAGKEHVIYSMRPLREVLNMT